MVNSQLRWGSRIGSKWHNKYLWSGNDESKLLAAPVARDKLFGENDARVDRDGGNINVVDHVVTFSGNLLTQYRRPRRPASETPVATDD